MKEVGAHKELWYNSTFTIPNNWKGKDILLHFGAVDWKTEIWINDIKTIGDISNLKTLKKLQTNM